jgi:hypothetical protein
LYCAHLVYLSAQLSQAWGDHSSTPAICEEVSAESAPKIALKRTPPKRKKKKRKRKEREEKKR